MCIVLIVQLENPSVARNIFPVRLRTALSADCSATLHGSGRGRTSIWLGSSLADFAVSTKAAK